MTSEANHGDGFNGDSESKPIHFFRIMYPETLLEGKLRIPGKFVRKYGNHLSHTMFLKLPNGGEWKVSVEKSDGGVCFQKGWKEFVEYYSLAHGHLLVFIYDGTSHFHVQIFGLSTMEIDYPLNNVNRKRTNNSKLQSRKTRRTSRKIKDESNSNLHDCKGMLMNPIEEKKDIDKHTKRSSISNCGETAENTSFRVILKSHHFKTCLFLPKGSVQSYIKPGGQNATLLVGDKPWSVNLIHYPNKSFTIISAGWFRFVKENNLEEGDACLFKLQDSSDDGVLKVSISKCSSSMCHK